MTSNEILRASLLDILFEKRNKQYGAYMLRKNYNQRLGMALGFCLSTAFLLFILLPQGNSYQRFTTVSDDSVILKQVELPHDVKKIIPLRQPKQQVIQVKQRIFQNPVLVQHIPVMPPPDIRDLIDADISNKNLNGNPDLGIATIQPAVAATQTPTETQTEFIADQKEPEFPGGKEAWLKFLRKNLVAPEELETGETKSVQIRFVVATDGSVTGFEIVQSAGRDFDNEVIRVLKKMPKWKPAIQNGQLVTRSYTQPVTFIGMEQ